jgi:hypothetical protein
MEGQGGKMNISALISLILSIILLPFAIRDIIQDEKDFYIWLEKEYPDA